MKYQIPIHKKVFIYGGNLGKPQGLEFLLEILQSNLQRQDIFFLIVGSGTEYKMIKSWFDLHLPTNAKIFKGLPKEDYDLLVASCDVGLIFLDPRFTIPNYPSRLLSYLENKMPIIAATDSNSDIGNIAKENGYGYVCLNGDIKAFNDSIELLLAGGKIVEMGQNGYNFLKKYYLVDHSYQIITSHLIFG